MGGDRARWEIYLLSEECRGRWWDSGKKIKFFCIFVFGFTHGWRQGKMGDLPGFGGIWRTLVGEWEKNLIIFIFVFGLMGGDRARWEIYLVSEEYGGRWWESEKKIKFLNIYFWINGWRQSKMGDLPAFRGMSRTLVGQWEKN